MPDEVRVLILNEGLIGPTLLDQLQAISPRLRVEQHPVKRGDDLGALDWRGVEVVLTTGAVPTLEQAPDLRWVQTYFAGPDRALRENRPLFERVKLTTASGVHMPVMGEYALMMMLAHAHRLPQLLRAQAAREWPANRAELFSVTELRGQTLGILGYGSIGREAGRLAQAAGMRVLAAKRNPDHHGDPGWHLPGTGDPRGEVPEAFFGLDRLDEMLPPCDFVLLVLPLTDQTRHVLNARTLALLKPTAFVINYGRGALIDEPALIAALQAGRLGGAALDVFEQEPLPASSPLWTLPNVILTPHISGWTARYDELAVQLFADNLQRYLAGEPLLNEVDIEAGY
jgi:phosphoglycerate dehydrogenase-like enzyme